MQRGKHKNAESNQRNHLGEAASGARQRIQDLVNAKTVTAAEVESGKPLTRLLMSPETLGLVPAQ
jgi:hypothetical protein